VNQPYTDVFLGALRSEYDTPNVLPTAFIQLESVVQQLLWRWKKAEITAEITMQAMSDLVLTGQDGVLWTVGASSGRWYRRLPNQGAAWVIASPPPATIKDPSWNESLHEAVDKVNKILSPAR